MELLYLPLPTDLKNRTKAFVDIFMDRFGRGLGAMVLMGYIALVEADPKHPNLTRVSALILGISLCWILLSVRVSREYLATIRRRLESRRLDFEDARISLAGAETVALLERTISDGSAAAGRLCAGPAGGGSGLRYRAARRRAGAACQRRVPDQGLPGGHGRALWRTWRIPLAGRSKRPGTTREHEAAMEYLVAVISRRAHHRCLGSNGGIRPCGLAAGAGRLRGRSSGQGHRQACCADCWTIVIGSVASAACRSAGRLGDRIYLEQIVQRLADHAVRGAAIESLAMFGAQSLRLARRHPDRFQCAGGGPPPDPARAPPHQRSAQRRGAGCRSRLARPGASHGRAQGAEPPACIRAGTGAAGRRNPAADPWRGAALLPAPLPAGSAPRRRAGPHCRRAAGPHPGDPLRAIDGAALPAAGTKLFGERDLQCLAGARFGEAGAAHGWPTIISTAFWNGRSSGW